MFSVGQRLRAVRDSLELTQEEVTAAINVRQNTYSNWENGKRLADTLAMIRLCDRYGVTLDWIYRGNLGCVPHDLASKLAAYFPRAVSSKKPRRKAS